eukprot:TRINITY_DN20371_c0_g1_i1.p1 TRINITY_DN20371_c0_g1~~TRINITY_DN20371_c0_g1_i1.p1  ORF type:complete len:338 (+),score=58.77 TRINITY_DN20371_c0_g1_i1:118-1131(+)
MAADPGPDIVRADDAGAGFVTPTSGSPPCPSREASTAGPLTYLPCGPLQQFGDVFAPFRTPAVLDLQALDREWERLVDEQRQKRLEARRLAEAEFAAVYERRRAILHAGDARPKAATPALGKFWLTVLQHADFEDIFDYDEPVLAYLQDLSYDRERLEGLSHVVRLRFSFAQNPYFANPVLSKEFYLEGGGPLHLYEKCSKILSTAINWYPGKNVTVKVLDRKGTRSSRRRQVKAKKQEVPRESFFRRFFRNLGHDFPLPAEEQVDMEPDETAAEAIERLLAEDYEAAAVIWSSVIPRAVRWYTGEAASDSEPEEAESESAESSESESGDMDTDSDF